MVLELSIVKRTLTTKTVLDTVFFWYSGSNVQIDIPKGKDMSWGFYKNVVLKHCEQEWKKYVLKQYFNMSICYTTMLRSVNHQLGPVFRKRSLCYTLKSVLHREKWNYTCQNICFQQIFLRPPAKSINEITCKMFSI
jgi:hypothetical protein